jgi:hypothetical protein
MKNYWEHVGEPIRNLMGTHWEIQKSNTPTLPSKENKNDP